MQVSDVVAGLLLLTSTLVASDKPAAVSGGGTAAAASALQRASALLAADRPREALTTLAGVHTGQSRFFEGLAYRQLSDHVRSRQSFLDAWSLGYKNDYVLYSIIQEDYALGDKPAGLEKFRSLLTAYPDSPWVDLLLADAYFAKEQNGAAREEYLKALKKKPDVLEANFRLGYMAFQNGDNVSAAQYFRKEIVANPKYVDAHLFLAEALHHLNRMEESLDELRKALALDENSELAYKRLVTTLIETNALGEADRVLTKAESRFPSDAELPAQHARVLNMLKRPKEARSEAEKAQRLSAEQARQREIVPSR